MGGAFSSDLFKFVTSPTIQPPPSRFTMYFDNRTVVCPVCVIDVRSKNSLKVQFSNLRSKISLKVHFQTIKKLMSFSNIRINLINSLCDRNRKYTRDYSFKNRFGHIFYSV